MPIEIRELQIKAVVQDAAAAPQGNAATATAPQNSEAIIAACVEQVLEILQQKNER